MAVVITPNGEHKKLSPQNGDKFTLWEISQILDGLVDIAFIGDKWVFINKLGHKRQFPYNEPASLIFNYPIAGLCIVANEDELPSQFLIPDKLKENDKDEFMYASNSGNLKSFSKTEDVDKKEEKLKEDAFKEAYYLLFETGKDINEIPQNFIIYRKGNKVVDLSNDMNKQLDLLNDMMEFYLELEEYEKCSNISKLLGYIQ